MGKCGQPFSKGKTCPKIWKVVKKNKIREIYLPQLVWKQDVENVDKPCGKVYILGNLFYKKQVKYFILGEKRKISRNPQSCPRCGKICKFMHICVDWQETIDMI